MTTTTAIASSSSIDTTNEKSRLPAPLSLRVLTQNLPEQDENRAATPIGRDDDHGQSPVSGEVAILSTAALEPLENATCDTITLALQDLKYEDDWLRQFEAIVVLRQAIVHHHTTLLDADTIHDMIPLFVTASNNLRSALSKNALIALQECCQFLGLLYLRPFLSSTRGQPSLCMEVILTRATCEKRFLREAASKAVDAVIQYLACPELIAAAACYATNKNAKIVAVASKIMAQSVVQLTTSHTTWDMEQFINEETQLSTIFTALISFRTGKESTARVESLSCLKWLAQALGKERFVSTLENVLKQDGHGMKNILADVFPEPEQKTLERRGSLKDRMMAQRQ